MHRWELSPFDDSFFWSTWTMHSVKSSRGLRWSLREPHVEEILQQRSLFRESSRADQFHVWFQDGTPEPLSCGSLWHRTEDDLRKRTPQILYSSNCLEHWSTPLPNGKQVSTFAEFEVRVLISIRSFVRRMAKPQNGSHRGDEKFISIGCRKEAHYWPWRFSGMLRIWAILRAVMNWFPNQNPKGSFHRDPDWWKLLDDFKAVNVARIDEE